MRCRAGRADDVDVSVHGERVTVRLRPPSPLRSVAERLAVTSSAAAKEPGGLLP